MESTFGSLAIPEMKDELKKIGAKQSDRKKELVERLDAYERNKNLGKSDVKKPNFYITLPDTDINADHTFIEKFDLSWPTPDMSIYRNFLPGELWDAMQETPVRHAIFVQTMNKGEDEARWVMQLASQHPFICGIVAGLDLTDPKLADTIPSLLKEVPLLKGARYVLDEEADDWITRDDVNAGLEVLAQHGLTFDLLVRPHHLKYVPSVVEKHPTLRFVIDHIAKPDIKTGVMEGWKEDIEKIAKYPNVFCKLSGLVTERDSETWTVEEFLPYIQHVLNVFTPDRCFYGSDWPVFTMLKASYKDAFGLLNDLVTRLCPGDRNKIFRDNAVKFYKLNL